MLYVLGLGCFTLYPWPQDPAAYCATHHLGAQLNPLQFIVDIRTDGVTAILQLGMNIVLFVPMGFFLTRFFRMPSWVAIAVCCATSICIEVAQLTGVFHLYPCAYRICDVDDVITNTLGGAVGVALGLWCNRAFPAPRIDKTEVTMLWCNRAFPAPRIDKTEVTMHPGFLRRCVSFAVDMGIVSMCQMLSIVLWSYLGHGPAPRIDKTEVTMHPGFLRRCVSFAVDMGIVSMCQMLSIVLWSYLGHGAVAPDGHAFLVLLSVWFVVFEGIVPWCTHGRTIGCFLTRMTVESGHGAVAPDGHAFLVLLSVWFVVFEGIVPWCTHGRTIGCFLTRMTVESGQRTMPQRLAFYVARTALLYTLTIGVYTWRSPWRTIGCFLTRMTVESGQRTMPQRLAFYVARTALLYTLTIGVYTWRSPWTFILGLATMVWWIACKQMPYDAIGEDRSRMGGTGWGHQSS